ncbi:mechanosensitive ion channel [Lichenibacterium minor]|uniref:Mechanosensitive ion channel n=1 Tax=Lichenibacterium minor TaxID=2316528 RepID=A0A4Q2UD02_9HYPH|nr:mechanosensitive ion channel domain-containing protein [Lichenibacterium minor]RYC32725.1 mechanosensitive ion channel [Lichenibacterium minor]
MDFLGVHWVGVTAENGKRLVLSILFVAAVLAVRAALRRGVRRLVTGEGARQARFWTHQGLNLLASLVVVFGLMSIWFDDPARLATAIGLFSAGLAFALQRVVTAFAGYIVILRGNNFTVGDRISMGGVRGDVLALGFIQTTLMEMGVAPGSDAGPSVWVKSRQFTGRIVTVSNSKIFEEPVYNYTRDFPFIWEEMSVTVRYEDDRAAVERIVMDAARRHAVDPAEISAEAARTLERRFELQRLDFEPRVFYRLTSNWLEMNLRFMSRDHGTRAIKDLIARDVLDGLDRAGIRVASVPYRVVEMPPWPAPPGAG